MQVFLWLAFLVMVAVAIFAVQNSTAPALTLKFLIWGWETSLLYVVLASLVAGMIIMLFMWVPFGLRATWQRRSLRKEIETLRRGARIEKDVEPGSAGKSQEKSGSGDAG